MLIYIAYSREPVHINLLRYAVSAEDDSKSLKALESSIPTEMAIVDVCANLISIDGKTQLVRFVHFSVQEFLTRHQFSIDTFRPGPELANREIARMLIALLKILYSEQLTYEDVKNFFGQLGTLHEWPYYLISANLGSLSTDDHMLTLVTSFFERSPPVPITPSQGLSPTDPVTSTYLSFSPSTLALMFDLPGRYEHYQPQPVYKKTFDYNHLEPICSIRPRRYINECYNRPAIIFDDRFAMHYATIILDCVPTVKRLCTHGYPIDYTYPPPLVPSTNVKLNKNCGLHFHKNWDFVPFKYKRSPLCSVRSEKVAKFLLDNGVSTDIKRLGHELHDPLSWLAIEGNTKTFELVSNRIVYQHARRHSTALLAFLHHGYWDGADVIRLLISKGVDVRGGKNGAALQAAVDSGNIEYIELLLDKGADVNAVGGVYGTALQAAAASRWGSVKKVQLLLDRGADVNAVGGVYGTALQAAVCMNNCEYIELLLDRGADVNAVGGMYGTALQAAVASNGGNVECMRLLLDRGAGVNAVGGVYGTALQAASASSTNIECMQLLLDRGADVNAVGGVYGTALQAAAAFNGANVEHMQLLLDRGADVNAAGGKDVQGISMAASNWCRLKAVKLLLSRGADVNSRGGKYGTALQAALALASPGRKPRNNVYDIEAWATPALSTPSRREEFSTLLARSWRESENARFDVLELLLDNGADITAYVQGSKYGDAPTAAYQLWKDDIYALSWFLALLESRGWKEGETAT